MATDLQIPYEKQALTADGATSGVLTVASTAKLRKGARVLLRADTLESMELVIDQVISGTTIGVRDPSKIGTARFDCSAYTKALNAAVVQNEQVDFYSRQWNWF